jgi:uncharacterized protein (TIGR02246 family)
MKKAKKCEFIRGIFCNLNTIQKKLRMKMKILVALVIIIIFSCNQQKTDTKSEGEKVMQTSRDWSGVVATGDVEKSLSYWADDAVVMSAGQPLLKGKKEIRKMVEGSFKTPGFKISWDPQSAEVSGSGDMAYLVEKVTMSMNDSTGKTITMHAKGVTVWKKQSDGSWKDVVDISTPEP